MAFSIHAPSLLYKCGVLAGFWFPLHNSGSWGLFYLVLWGLLKMTTFLLWALGFFAWFLVGGVIVGVGNAFSSPNKRLNHLEDTGFIGAVVMWPIMLAFFCGWGALKAAEVSCKMAQEQTQRLRDVQFVALPGVVEGELEEPERNKPGSSLSVKSNDR